MTASQASQWLKGSNSMKEWVKSRFVSTDKKPAGLQEVTSVKTKSLVYKGVASFAIISILLLFVAFVAPYFLTLNHIKSEISARISNDIRMRVEIFGDVNFAILPHSKVILNNVKLAGDDLVIEVPSLGLDTSVVDILLGKVNVFGMEISNTQLTWKSLDYLAEVLSHSVDDGFNLLSNLRLHESEVVLNPQATLFSKIQRINGALSYQYGKVLNFSGSFVMDAVPYNMTVSLNYEDQQGHASTALLTSDFIELSIIGNMSHVRERNFDGKMKLKLLESPRITLKTPVLYNALLADKLAVESDFMMRDDAFEISNFKVFGNSIKNMSGNATIVIGTLHQINANIISDAIDLDGLLAHVHQIESQGNIQPLSLEGFVRQMLLAFNFDIPENIFGQINVKINELMYQRQAMLNMLINSSMLEGEFLLNDFSIALPGKSSLKIQGVAMHNKIRPKFDGKMKFEIQDYNAFNAWMKIDETLFEHLFNKSLIFQSNISVMPRNMRFDDASLNWGDLRVLGKLVMKYSGDDRLSARASLNINDLNADSLNISKKWDDLLTQLYAYDLDKSGEKFTKITGDFQWLRQFPFNFNLDAYIGQLRFKGMQFPRFSSTIRLAPNMLALEQIALSSDEAEIGGSLILNTAAITPKLSLDLVIPKLDVLFVDKLLPSHTQCVDAQQKALQEYPDLAEVITLGGANFYSLRNIVSDISIKIGHLIGDHFKAHQVQTNINILDGIAHIANFSSKIWGGELEAIGSVVFNGIVPIYNLSFAFNNFDFGDFNKFYSHSDDLTGYASVSGSISSKGSNFNDFYNNFNGNINMLGKNITWTGFDIGELIKLSEYSASIEEKNKILEHALVNGKSFFDNLSGRGTLTKGMLAITDMQISTPRISGALSLNLNMQYKSLSHFTRISFIPVGRRNNFSIDITGGGKFGEIKNTYNYEKYLQFLKNDPILAGKNSSMQVAPSGLRNF
jgi:hypothetical protein